MLKDTVRKHHIADDFAKLPRPVTLAYKISFSSRTIADGRDRIENDSIKRPGAREPDRAVRAPLHMGA